MSLERQDMDTVSDGAREPQQLLLPNLGPLSKTRSKVEEVPDSVGEILVREGFAPSAAVLGLNGTLKVPYTMDLPAPFHLPSRLFRFPIEVIRPDPDQPSRLGLMHPLLVEHPFVRSVEAALGFEIDRLGVENRYGYSRRPTALWWHAVDLVSAGLWADLLATAQFTTSDMIADAVCYGLSYSPDKPKKDRGYITLDEARVMLSVIGLPEVPADQSFPHAFMKPSPLTRESGRVEWPINHVGPGDRAATVWGYVTGVERGWFIYDRAGFLVWSEKGRLRYEDGNWSVKSGGGVQMSFSL